MCVVCALCVCVCVSLDPPKVQLKIMTSFFSVIILEPWKPDWPFCAFTQQILLKRNCCNNVPATLESQCCKKFSLQSCSSLWLTAVFDYSACFAKDRAPLTNEQHVATHDSHWNTCTSADPGIPLYLEGWQLLAVLINQNYADCFRLNSLISTQNCTQWLEWWQVAVISWVIKS